MKKLLSTLALVVAACASDDGTDDPGTTGNAEGHESIKSTLDRNLAPAPTPAEMAALATGNHALTVDLYQAAASDTGNTMISTLSIRTAFAMVYAGARGTTAAEMASVLRFDSDQERFHEAMNALDLSLASRELEADSEEKLDPVELRQANAFWGQTGIEWRESYLDALAVNYGAGIESLDLRGRPEASRTIINDWVADRTRDRIEDLLPEGSIKSNTAAVLTNAIYFKAPWLAPFEELLTTPGSFDRADGSTSTVDYMTQLEDLSYAVGSGWTAVELPFRGEELSMVFVVPDAGTFDAFDAGLTTATLEQAMDALQPGLVDLTLPKFEFETEFTLSEALMGLGMVETFTSADLSGMTEGRSLFVDEAFHKTFVAVNESGAEAAAATAVVIGETSVPTPELTLRIDRPFYFFIRDRETKVWLFFGRVMDPAA
jgi:serpin B